MEPRASCEQASVRSLSKQTTGLRVKPASASQDIAKFLVLVSVKALSSVCHEEHARSADLLRCRGRRISSEHFALGACSARVKPRHGCRPARSIPAQAQGNVSERTTIRNQIDRSIWPESSAATTNATSGRWHRHDARLRLPVQRGESTKLWLRHHHNPRLASNEQTWPIESADKPALGCSVFTQGARSKFKRVHTYFTSRIAVRTGNRSR
ncbi:hypothetical protein BAUCODRAFT_519875 [Baudoinia panamericana UAMH 10762]|uniref:Uncharacterized protein n=1 Tax=Baudoinia panamericana (strain UAMH 10762) TaxID=717646 RepID=M2MEE4_BAUPA|nr:uncharacterized protein BAUCODRAFT_519875 [Baudoinia panamericana UAMH 10762]EMC94946.1 hypothetical protein BAUCODRAFT_519875 [Baudoinia panamericana UAMH 10762]